MSALACLRSISGDAYDRLNTLASPTNNQTAKEQLTATMLAVGGIARGEYKRGLVVRDYESSCDVLMIRP
jgi:hypothetical protein